MRLNPAWLFAIAAPFILACGVARADDVGTMEVTVSLVNPDGPLYQLESLSDQDELMLGQTLILKEGAIPIAALRVISKTGRPVKTQARQIKTYDKDKPLREGSQYTAVFTRRHPVKSEEASDSERREPDLPEDWDARPKGFFEPLGGYMFGNYGSTSVSGLEGGLSVGVKAKSLFAALDLRFGGLKRPQDLQTALSSTLGLGFGYELKPPFRLRLLAGVTLVDHIQFKNYAVSATETLDITAVGNGLFLGGYKLGLGYLLKDWLALNFEVFAHSYSVYTVNGDDTAIRLPSRLDGKRYILSVSFPFSRAYEGDTTFHDF
jgi:hypothetical protein